jgi:hypothetical protein
MPDERNRTTISAPPRRDRGAEALAAAALATAALAVALQIPGAGALDALACIKFYLAQGCLP